MAEASGLKIGAQEIAHLLDNGDAKEALERLRFDLQKLCLQNDGSSKMSNLLTTVEQLEKKDKGWNLEISSPYQDEKQYSMIKPEEGLRGKLTALHHAIPGLEIEFGLRNEIGICVEQKDGIVIPFLSGDVTPDRGQPRFVATGAGFAESQAARDEAQRQATQHKLELRRLPELEIR